MNRILLHSDGIAKVWEVGDGRISIRIPDGSDLTGQAVITIPEASVDSLADTLAALVMDRSVAR